MSAPHGKSRRFRRARALTSLLALAAASPSCGDPTRYATVRVRDPDRLAAAAATVHYGTGLDRLHALKLGGRSFPLTFGLKSTRDEEHELWVEARDAAGALLGRGRTTVALRKGSSQSSSVDLRPACATSADCVDELFCNGDGTCVDGMCLAADPCVSAVACVRSRCDEPSRTCVTTLDDTQCSPGTTCVRDYGCIPCNAGLCDVGESCDATPDSPTFGECLTCDSPERCGAECAACPAVTPLCAGVEVGCLCDEDPPPRGSCPGGSACEAGACVACSEVTRCGPNCDDCTLTPATPVCGGVEPGCVTVDCATAPDLTPCQISTSSERSYDVCRDGVCISPGCLEPSCIPPEPTYARADVEAGWRMPTTGQPTCFDGTAAIPCPVFPCNADGTPAYCGQDAQYAAEPATPRWRRLAGDEPIVEDTVTGLAWQGCLLGSRGQDCSAGAPAALGAATAVRQCEGLRWGGFADWRVPALQELVSLVDHSTTQPMVDAGRFPNTPVHGAFSADAFSEGTLRHVAFSTGEANYGLASTAYHLRCVRWSRTQAGHPAERFNRSLVAASEPVTRDGYTGLAWQGCSAGVTGDACDVGSPVSVTWRDALAYCEALSWAGSAAWRLPNRLELLSIVEHANLDPTIDETAFPGTPHVRMWTSTSSVSAPTHAFTVHFASAQSLRYPKSSAAGVRCVQ